MNDLTMYCKCGEKSMNWYQNRWVCINCGTVRYIDTKLFIYNELVEFVNDYNYDLEKVKEIFEVYNMMKQPKSAIRKIFTKLNIKPKYKNRFMYKCNKKIKQLYETKLVVL